MASLSNGIIAHEMNKLTENETPQVRSSVVLETEVNELTLLVGNVIELSTNVLATVSG
jgi:hypothetical protein